MQNTLTPKNLALKAKAANPSVRYAYAENSVGAFDPKLNRFVVVAGLLLTGEWASMPFDLLVNGKPIEREWKEV